MKCVPLKNLIERFSSWRLRTSRKAHGGQARREQRFWQLQVATLYTTLLTDKWITTMRVTCLAINRDGETVVCHTACYASNIRTRARQSFDVRVTLYLSHTIHGHVLCEPLKRFKAAYDNNVYALEPLHTMHRARRVRAADRQRADGSCYLESGHERPFIRVPDATRIEGRM